MPARIIPRLRKSALGASELDQFKWVTGAALRCYGVRVGIRSTEPALLHEIEQHLPAERQWLSAAVVDRVYSFVVERRKGRRRPEFVLYADDVELRRSTDRDDILEGFESDLRLFVAELATHRVFVHAGVVGWKGKGIVIPGRSFSGKSTLVAELVRAGATYYSDEYAVLDSRGRVHPFWKPLELRAQGEFRQTKVQPDELGISGTKPLQVGLVLMTHFRPDARWSPRKLTPGEGVLELLFNTVSARRRPERALATLQRVTAQADVLKGVRGDATKVAPALLRRVEQKDLR
jgi:hypothetical protein